MISEEAITQLVIFVGLASYGAGIYVGYWIWGKE